MDKVNTFLTIAAIFAAVYIAVSQLMKKKSGKSIPEVVKAVFNHSGGSGGGTQGNGPRPETIPVDICIVTATNIKTRKEVVASFDPSKLSDSDELIAGRETKEPEHNRSLFMALPDEDKVTSENHFFIFKQTDANGVKFGVCDCNSRNHLYLYIEETDRWDRVDYCIIDNNTRLRAGAYTFSFMFSNYYDRCSQTADQDDEVTEDNNTEPKNSARTHPSL